MIETEIKLYSDEFVSQQITDLEKQFLEEVRPSGQAEPTPEEVDMQFNTDLRTIEEMVGPEARESIRKSTQRKPGGPGQCGQGRSH